ncbi:MAG: imidazolonepropionase [Bacteroidota bacterium]|nr:imidazolonepropionase [Bacteroidota bacterium]MDX5426979.1 imidazolonepropionase [Bacteroidota bacterium]MDX5448756.1 imidazolonepropionase [Bacteroidota bacterium]MDX5504967.1 imidazolonepropionase [Bacteroidota bacterium]
MKKLITNIKQLIGIENEERLKLTGKDMGKVSIIENAFIEIRDGIIHDFGPMSSLQPQDVADVSEIISAQDRLIMPTFADSHTHLVFAGPRQGEYRDRLHGLTYQEIAARGGGILNSVKALRKMSEEQLLRDALSRLEEVIHYGTGAIEIKSGYGLSVEAEMKILRVIQKLKYYSPIPIRATFLGAHAYPTEFASDHKGYIDLLVNEMIPKVASEGLAEFIDIFCEDGYFSVDDTERVLKAGLEHKLIPKVHVNQFTSFGGLQKSLEYEALSVDHLEVMTSEDIDSLKNSYAMPTALPACSFFIGIPYTPGRQMIDQGLGIALATDYNPGSSPTGNMQFVQSLACLQMKLTPEEALNASTLNSAYAMGMSDEIGSITKGKRANLIMTKPIPDLAYMTYNFGANDVDRVFVDGNEITSIDKPLRL